MRVITLIFTNLINILLPGSGLVILGRYRQALFIQSTLIGLVVLFCWSRILFSPAGLVTFVLALLITYIAAIIMLFQISRQSVKKQNVSTIFSIRQTLIAFVFMLVTTSLFVTGYIYKHDWLGVDVYFIPSVSMRPALEPGDFVLVDTWWYDKHDPQLGDVVIFTRPNTPGYYVKRVSHWPDSQQLKQNHQWYVLGDNQRYSKDSRLFGGIREQQILAKARLVITSSNETAFIQPQRVLIKVD